MPFKPRVEGQPMKDDIKQSQSPWKETIPPDYLFGPFGPWYVSDYTITHSFTNISGADGQVLPIYNGEFHSIDLETIDSGKRNSLSLEERSPEMLLKVIKELTGN